MRPLSSVMSYRSDETGEPCDSGDASILPDSSWVDSSLSARLRPEHIEIADALLEFVGDMFLPSTSLPPDLRRLFFSPNSDRSRPKRASLTYFLKLVTSLMVATLVPRSFMTISMNSSKPSVLSTYSPSSSQSSKTKSACSSKSDASTPTCRNALQALSFFTMSWNSALEMLLSWSRSSDSCTMLAILFCTSSMSMSSFSRAETRQATSHKMPMSMLVIVRVARTRNTKNAAE
mmetsp:Transcript_26928/g.62791  ORF Transcript_26928/g.62791 Transcript_26928/m.62791 type:complete len:233 (+) Transcript_26928:289-987(+)